MHPTTTRLVTLSLLLLLLPTGCPKQAPPPLELEPDPVASIPADEALRTILAHELARDAGSEVVPFARHPDAAVRAAAMRALGRMGQPEALRPIAFRLQDPDPDVRIAAAFALGLAWAWDADDDAARLLIEDQVEEVLAEALDTEEDGNVRDAIARAMGNGAGASAWDDLEQMVLHGDRQERLAALEGMAMLGRRGIAQPVSSELLDPLLPALVVQDPEVQWWCAYLLLRCPLADDAVRERAHTALQQAAAGTDDPALRAVIARALAAVGHGGAETTTDAVFGLIAAPPDSGAVAQGTTAERVAVARSLGAVLGRHMEDERTVALLGSLCADADPAVRETAATSLAAAGEATAALAADALLPLATDPDPAVRVSAISALAILEIPDRVALLEQLDPDPVPFVEAARLSARAALGFEEPAFEAFMAGVEGAPPVVRLGVFEAFAQRSDDPLARGALLSAFSQDDPNLAVLAVDALAEVEDEQVRATIIESYDRWTGFAGAEVREHIIDAMADGDPVPPGWFDAALDDPQRPVRRAAARAIRGTGRHVVAHPDPMPEVADPLLGVDDVTGARFVTDHGVFEVELYPELAPSTVASFVALAEQGFHDGVTFHRVIPSFVIQGGCPDATGWGGPGYAIRSEFNALAYEPGTLGMARSAVDSEGSQWFVTHDRQPHLTGHYTAFGRVTQGMDVVHAIGRGDTVLAVEILRAREAPPDPPVDE